MFIIYSIVSLLIAIVCAFGFVKLVEFVYTSEFDTPFKKTVLVFVFLAIACLAMMIYGCIGVSISFLII